MRPCRTALGAKLALHLPDGGLQSIRFGSARVRFENRRVSLEHTPLDFSLVSLRASLRRPARLERRVVREHGVLKLLGHARMVRFAADDLVPNRQYTVYVHIGAWEPVGIDEPLRRADFVRLELQVQVLDVRLDCRPLF